MKTKIIVVTILLFAFVESRYARDLGSLESKKTLDDIEKPLQVKDVTQTASSLKSKTLEDLGLESGKEMKQVFDLLTDKTKRQTTIRDNQNRLNNLINLPVRLNVLANILSIINQGVVAHPDKPLSENDIIGNGNTISSLINAPLDVNAAANILSEINTSRKNSTNGKNSVLGGLLGGILGAGGSESQKDLVGGLLGGLLGSGNESCSGLLGGLLGGIVGDESLVGSLLGNTLGDVVGTDGLLGDLLGNALGDILGNTLGDLLGALLGNDALVNNVLGTVGGQGLVSQLLNSVLGSVVRLVDNLLDLLQGLLTGLLIGLSNANVTQAGTPGLNIEGNNNVVSSLIIAPTRINALIIVLNNLKQEITVNPAASVVLKQKGVTTIEGNNNKVSSLINLPLNADINLNVLSDVTQTLLGKHDSKPHAEEPGTGHLVAGQPISTRTSNIEGNGNTISNLINVAPDINANLNILSQLTELLGGSQGGMVSDTDSNEICFDIPITPAENSIKGNNNKVSSAINVSPKINLDLNLLSNIKRTGGKIPSHVPTQRVCIKKPTDMTKPTTTAPIIVQSPTEVCFDVVEQNSDLTIQGNNNQVSSLVNVKPKLNLGLNLLSNVQQVAASSPNLSIKRICIPIETGSKPAVTPTPTTPKPLAYTSPYPEKRCFRRTCTNWKQFVDYDCITQPSEYPTYTYTHNI